jgi:serine/threonine protein kinase
MPLADGGDLSKRVLMYKGSLDSVIIVSKQLCRGLHAAHSANIIHRDIKPENILFTGTGHDAVLTDFGICLIRSEARITDAGEVVGPWAFMPPEVEGGGELDVTPAGDIYSLGKLIYYMISGGVVLPRERLAESPYADVLSGGQRYTLLRALLSKMICDASSRLQTAASVLSELEQIERWEQTARIVPISKRGYELVDSLKQRALENTAIQTQKQSQQDLEVEKVSNVRDLLMSWLEDKLTTIAATLQTDGVLEFAVERLAKTDPIRHRLGLSNISVPIDGMVLIATFPNSQIQSSRAIQFLLCQEGGRVTVQIGSNPLAAPARETSLLFLPLISYANWSNAVPTPVGFVNRIGWGVQRISASPYSNVTLFTEFYVSHWPGILKSCESLIRDALEIFFEDIKQRGT